MLLMIVHNDDDKHPLSTSEHYHQVFCFLPFLFCMCVRPSICLSLSVCLPACLSVCLSVHVFGFPVCFQHLAELNKLHRAWGGSGLCVCDTSELLKSLMQYDAEKELPFI